MATYIRTLIWTAWIGLSAVLLYALPLVSAGILCALSGAALHALFKGRRRQFWKNPISLGLLNKRQKYGRSMRVMKAGEGRVDSSNVKRGGAEPGSAPIRVRSPLPDSADTSDVRPATTAMNRGSRRYRQIALNEDVIIAPEDRIALCRGVYLVSGLRPKRGCACKTAARIFAARILFGITTASIYCECIKIAVCEHAGETLHAPAGYGDAHHPHCATY